jgi:hypothetical protein
MNEDVRAQLKIWDNKDEEDEALEADYQSLMEWWKSNPAPKLLLIHEMFEMVTNAKFWVWYCNDQDQTDIGHERFSTARYFLQRRK